MTSPTAPTTATARDSSIIRSLADGNTVRQVADRFGLPTAKVCGIAASHGILIDDLGHAKDTPALTAATAAAGGNVAPPLPATTDPAQLLDRALTHPVARIRNKATKARDLLAQVAELLHAEAERDLARARIAKLQRDLAAERKRLRSKPNPAYRPRRIPGGTLPCPDCDAKFTTPQGVNMHRFRVHGHRGGGAA